jgi:hypothetical protein
MCVGFIALKVRRIAPGRVLSDSRAFRFFQFQDGRSLDDLLGLMGIIIIRIDELPKLLYFLYFTNIISG